QAVNLALALRVSLRCNRQRYLLRNRRKKPIVMRLILQKIGMLGEEDRIKVENTLHSLFL
ncbi:MAG: hypothetical protein K2Q14_07465, partial [Gammaproteobacteria bacterium]|nr:hypothetical protein [Gammaproteobacteria bacterium]